MSDSWDALPGGPSVRGLPELLFCVSHCAQKELNKAESLSSKSLSLRGDRRYASGQECRVGGTFFESPERFFQRDGKPGSDSCVILKEETPPPHVRDA